MDRLGLFIVVGLVVCIGLMFAADYAERRDCEGRGGALSSKTTVSFTTNMTPAFGSVSFCITPDGRILK